MYTGWKERKRKFTLAAPVTADLTACAVPQVDQLSDDAREEQREEADGGTDCEALHGDHPPAHRPEPHPGRGGCHHQQVSAGPRLLMSL